MEAGLYLYPFGYRVKFPLAAIPEFLWPKPYREFSTDPLIRLATAGSLPEGGATVLGCAVVCVETGVEGSLWLKLG